MYSHSGRNDLTSGSRCQEAFLTLLGVVCGAALLGLVGSGAGAMWSLALGHGAAVGALCGGLIVFAQGLVLVPVNARLGTVFPLGATAIVILFLGMVVGAIVWGIRVAVR